jgi:hypothetical protein
MMASSSDAEESLLEPDLTVTVACGAGRRARTLLGTAAVALTASLVVRDRNFLFYSECRFLERQIDVVSQVGSPLDTPATAPAAKEISEPEKVAEDIAEIREYTRIETATGSAADAGMAEAVVVCSLLCIA